MMRLALRPIALALLLAWFAFAFALGCGDEPRTVDNDDDEDEESENDDTMRSPEEVVSRFLKLVAEDPASAYEVLHPSLIEVMHEYDDFETMLLFELAEFADQRLSVGSATINGDQARVTIESTFGYEDELNLVRMNDAWYITVFDAGPIDADEMRALLDREFEGDRPTIEEPEVRDPTDPQPMPLEPTEPTPSETSHRDAARVAMRDAQVEQLFNAVQRYFTLCDGRGIRPALPETLDDLIDGPADWPGEWNPLVRNVPESPWGHEYELIIEDMERGYFTIVCYGRDGKPGGEGLDEEHRRTNSPYLD